MSQDTLKIEDQSNELTVKLRTNPFDKTSYIGSIKRQTITLGALASRIADSDSGISEYEVVKVAGYLKKEILKAVRRGQAINVLGLGVMYLSPDGTISTSTPNAALSQNLTLRFRISDDALEAVSGVKVNTVTINDPAPQINAVESVPFGEDGTTFTAGKAVRISGSKLKIGGKDGGIFLCKVDDDGDMTETVQVPEEQFIRNRQTELDFFIPADIAAGNYRIKLATRYLSNTSERKSLVTALSDVITISATA